MDWLLTRYNLALAQAVLYDATEVRIRVWDHRVYSAMVDAIDYQERVFVVILDEVDKLVETAGDGILYTFRASFSHVLNHQIVSTGMTPGGSLVRNSHTYRPAIPPMEQPEPADEWPDRPLSEAEAESLLEDEIIAVWVMDHETGVRTTVLPSDAPDDAVVDIVLETSTGFEMYSFSRGQWMDYGTQRKDDEETPSMAGTLDSYRVLAGESEAF